MKTYRLNEKHPDFQKLEKLFDYMDKAGIRISAGIEGGHGAQIIIGDNHYWLRDIDRPDSAMDEFPPSLEWKLNFEKD